MPSESSLKIVFKCFVQMGLKSLINHYTIVPGSYIFYSPPSPEIRPFIITSYSECARPFFKASLSALHKKL